jgi:hypothetical protein
MRCSPLKVNRRFRGSPLLTYFLSVSAWLTLRPIRWRRHISPKRRLTFNGLYSVISHKIGLFIRSAIVQAVIRRRPGFEPKSDNVGFVVHQVALEQASSEYFGLACQFSFHRLLHIHHHVSSGAGRIGQLMPTYQVDSVSPHPQKKTKKKKNGGGLFITTAVRTSDNSAQKVSGEFLRFSVLRPVWNI